MEQTRERAEMSEVVRDLTTDEARTLTATIVNGMNSVHAQLITADRGRAWLALGYASWDAYCDGELAGARPAIERDERREIVGELRQAGMSQRAIGSVLGVHPTTVHGDIHAGAENSAPAPARIQGLDGQSYSSSRPAPPAAPQPSPAEREMYAALERGEIVVANMRGAHAHLIKWAESVDRYVRIDRRTEWGNPFEMPVDGDRSTVIGLYAEHYLPYKPGLIAKLADLRGKALGCWCAPEACHGDVLKAWAER
jgi:hypothetical protein